MTQVLSNLLLNAAKYTKPNGTITLGTALEPDALILRVEDNGIGLAPDVAAHVFEMFYQSAPVLERGQGGLGIGLALANALVHMHGGRMEVESAGPDRGSTFSVILPRSVVLERPHETGPEWKAPAAAAGGRALRVLVADDNADAADTLAMMLQLAGHQVHVAHNGADALEVARRVKPDVAMLDIGMPEMSGYELCARLRSEPWGERMRVIAVTGWGRDEDKRAALAAGFDHHLTKPVDPGALDRVLGP